MKFKNDDTLLEKTLEAILAPLLTIMIIGGILLTVALVFLFLIPAIFTAIIIAVAIGSLGTAIAIVFHAFRHRSKSSSFRADE
jgi:hypothetical protein